MQTAAGRARRQRWLLGYAALLAGSWPLALPCWNGWLGGWVGGWLTVEAVHVLQYGGLGWLGAAYARTLASAGRRGAVVGGLAAVGVLDEAVQRWLPQRVFQWSDIGWNWAGLLLGVILCIAASSVWRRARN